jgi:hypothetical protein
LFSKLFLGSNVESFSTTIKLFSFKIEHLSSSLSCAIYRTLRTETSIEGNPATEAIMSSKPNSMNRAAAITNKLDLHIACVLSSISRSVKSWEREHLQIRKQRQVTKQ